MDRHHLNFALGDLAEYIYMTRFYVRELTSPNEVYYVMCGSLDFNSDGSVCHRWKLFDTHDEVKGAFPSGAFSVVDSGEDDGGRWWEYESRLQYNRLDKTRPHAVYYANENGVDLVTFDAHGSPINVRLKNLRDALLVNKMRVVESFVFDSVAYWYLEPDPVARQQTNPEPGLHPGASGPTESP